MAVKRHLHSWQIVTWIDKPTTEEDALWHRVFNIKERCVYCDKEKTRVATSTEIENYLEAIRCPHCRVFNRGHQTQLDCIRDLTTRLAELEQRLDEVERERRD